MNLQRSCQKFLTDWGFSLECLKLTFRLDSLQKREKWAFGSKGNVQIVLEVRCSYGLDLHTHGFFLLLFLPLSLRISALSQLMGYNEKPVNLQMFIGTADDRYLRPHAFYQVHRITGKTVATASQEIIISSTKVLEISLLPENNMSARWVSWSLKDYITQLNYERYLLALRKTLKV